jgi:ATP-dependent Lon protease
LADQIEGRFDLLTLAGTEAPIEIAGNMIVLDGPPGAGKTVALQWLTERMRIEYELISFAELSNGFDLSGQSRGWSSGKMGKVARLLLGKQIANPFIVLDELDKGHNNDDNFPPTKQLYTLLEKESAVRFSDEFLELKMDASHINWVATCNEFGAIPEPIRDRCRRIVISQPDQMQRISITKSLYRDMRKKNARLWGDLFAPEISDDVAYILASAPGISVRRLVDLVDQCVIETARRTTGKSTAQRAVIEDDAGKVIRRLKGASSSREPIGFIQ